MAIFETGIIQTSSPGTISTLIWNPANTSATTFGSLGSVSSTAVLKDVVVINQGSVPIYVNSGSAASTTLLGVQVPVGGQLPILGYSGVGAAAGSLWANTGVVGQIGAASVGMASVASVV